MTTIRAVLKRKKIILWIGLSLIILTCLRLLWIHLFMTSDHYRVVNGQLDLRDWDATAARTITLDGQWEFYPHEWLINNKVNADTRDNNRTLIQVPGSWNAGMQPEGSTPFGYGSYRLQVLVNKDDKTDYAISIPSVRSSSEFYLNGRLLAQSGQPASLKENYTPRNVPYSASFTGDHTGVIEIVIQAANYDDSRSSGIIRSMKFGTEQAIQQDIQLSIAMQRLIFVAFMIHAVYAIILYLIGYRDRRLLYFAVLILCAIVAFAGNGDKILLSWIDLSYEWDFKLKALSMLVGVYSLIQCIKQRLSPFWSNQGFTGYSVLCGIAGLMVLSMPLEYLMPLQNVLNLIVTISCLTAFVVILRMTLEEIETNFYLQLAVVAFMSSIAWEFILIATGIKVIFYPFDLIVVMIACASIWFKRYIHIFAEMEKLAAKLQRTDKLKDEFLANTSHELRNPLHGILNISQAVLDREKSTLNDKSIKDLEMVLTVGRRMSLMLGDLLDMMRLKENSIMLRTENVSIQRIAADVMDILRFMTDGKPVQLKNQIPDSFPLVIADENRLIQILFNLLHNAVKHTIQGEVSIRAQMKNNSANIYIMDTGIGIDEEMQQRIFEPYEQADPDQTAIRGGFGLGLSICKQLVELHGGTLKVSSVPGQGSIFHFDLALSAAVVGSEAQASDVELFAMQTEVAATTVHHSQVRGLSSESGTGKIRILAVDDDPINLNVLMNIFSLESDYEIVTAISAQDALTLLDTREWDLVITDVIMPYMSGYELTHRIRERFDVYELPILLLTARIRPEDIEAGFLSGANDYVTKPVNPIELRARVRALTHFKKSVNERLNMEAAWLQAQIKPHFILNTLNAVLALSDIDTDKMRNLAEEFTMYLRSSFDFQNSDRFVQLEHELDLVRSYLNIEQERFGDRLSVVWEVDEGIQLEIPPLSIQPLVENAVIHGVLKNTQGGTIHIQITDHGQFVEIRVADNGAGINKEKLGHILNGKFNKGLGIGLRNTNLRLKQLYRTGLTIESEQGQGTVASFVVTKN
ncbi:ATP-binding protein [Paenibacillus periandrae]|uniref:ATP-binding protein n=1 Tax=Paenibacillus periandrae TaxID=1761741 RepID=UPI001F0912C8|nr:ATP-binding protein [Paenibacillus periandrae]